MESVKRREHASEPRAVVLRKEIEEEGYFGTWIPGGGQIPPEKKVRGVQQARLQGCKETPGGRLVYAVPWPDLPHTQTHTYTPFLTLTGTLVLAGRYEEI